MEKKYNIVATTWHVMHYYDLFNALKDDANFYLITNQNREWRSDNYLGSRPIPENVTFVPYYEKGKYDAAILNVDMQTVNPNLGKSHLVRELNKTITDVPKIFINHGTPIYPEYLAVDGMTFSEAEEEHKRLTKEIVGNNTMVVNSHDAVKHWGWGYPIWHGIEASEWWDLPKEPRVGTAVSIAGCDKYYNREFINKTITLFKEISGYEFWWAKMNTAKLYRGLDTYIKPEYYKDFLGRTLIYFDGTKNTPMNRGRTEAMLSGCCVVQIKGAHDLNRFAKDGENMILVDENPEDTAEILYDLIENQYERCVEIGQNAKKMAAKTFNRERYRKDWLALLNKVIK